MYITAAFNASISIVINGSKRLFHVENEIPHEILIGGQRLFEHAVRDVRYSMRRGRNENGELSILALLVYICIIKYMYIRARTNTICKRRPVHVFYKYVIFDRQGDNQFSTKLAANHT